MQKFFQLMESSVELALGSWPSNSVTAKNGISLCECFLLTVEQMTRYQESNEGKAFVKSVRDTQDKYEQILEKLNPESAKQYKEAKAAAEAGRAKAEAELAAQNAAKAGKQKQEGGCFIATACYGDYDHPAVMELRQFRDNYLEKSVAGQMFVRWYYQWSPAFANLIKNSRSLKVIVRFAVIVPVLTMARMKRRTENI